MPDYLEIDPFTRLHVGPHGAFVLRTNAAHVRLACAAVAHRLDVPVGAIEVDWSAVRGKRPAVKLRRAA